MDTVEVQCNIIGDYVQILRRRLIGLGYTKCSIDSIKDNYNLVLAYFGALRRLVSKVPRKVFKATGFVYPPMYGSVLAEIERRIRRGENINPYLSRKLPDLRVNDDLLNDWGIQHLHLGKSVITTEGKNEGRIQGTRDLLYVYFTEQSAYFIVIGDHHTFAKQELLRILHDNWPELLKQYEEPSIKSVIPDDLTSEHRRALRKAGYNMAVDIMPDGTAYMMIGGGRTWSGDNSIDVRQTNHLHNWAYHQTNNLRSCIAAIVTELRTKHGLEIREPIVLRLLVEGKSDSQWFLSDEYGRFTIGIEGPWPQRKERPDDG